MITKKMNLDYENLCFKYKNFINGVEKSSFNTGDFKILFNKINELEIVIQELDNYTKDNNIIEEYEKKLNKEYSINSFLKIENNKFKEEIKQNEFKFHELLNLLEQRQNELKELERNSFRPKKKIQQITEQQIQEIKNLRNQNLSYSEIEHQTKWSKFTISKVLNGHYDTNR